MWENTLPRRGSIYELSLGVKLSLKGENPEEGGTERVELGWRGVGWRVGGSLGGSLEGPGVSPHCPPSSNLLSCRAEHYF